jgi:uncharacterized protein YbjT (DUF2867 family)
MSVRCLVRDPARASQLEREGCELRRGDVTDAASLEGAGSEIDVAYFLIHAMAGGKGFEQREHEGALNFARMAKREGVKRVIYLGGLGDESVSKHLRSRDRTARILADAGPPLTYFRAAMVVGAESESYRTLRHLVRRLPVMIAPSWLQTATQPIGIDDVIAYLARAPDVPESAGREVQIGGPASSPRSTPTSRVPSWKVSRRRRSSPIPPARPRSESSRCPSTRFCDERWGKRSRPGRAG